MQQFILPRHVSHRLTLARRTGPCPPEQEIRFTVLLHARNLRILRDTSRSVTDPKSSVYGRHFSPD